MTLLQLSEHRQNDYLQSDARQQLPRQAIVTISSNSIRIGAIYRVTR